MGEQMKLYEGGYKAFKKCLVDAWPTGKVTHCAHMVMIDVKFPVHLMDTWWCVMRDINAFALSINMPSFFAKTNVSTYLAMYYPKTSAALFEGKSKDEAFKIIMGEKADRSKRKTVYQEARAEFRKSDKYITIKARSLSKNHDWNTVK